MFFAVIVIDGINVARVAEPLTILNLLWGRPNHALVAWGIASPARPIEIQIVCRINIGAMLGLKVVLYEVVFPAYFLFVQETVGTHFPKIMACVLSISSVVAVFDGWNLSCELHGVLPQLSCLAQGRRQLANCREDSLMLLHQAPGRPVRLACLASIQVYNDP